MSIDSAIRKHEDLIAAGKANPVPEPVAVSPIPSPMPMPVGTGGILGPIRGSYQPTQILATDFKSANSVAGNMRSPVFPIPPATANVTASSAAKAAAAAVKASEIAPIALPDDIVQASGAGGNLQSGPISTPASNPGGIPSPGVPIPTPPRKVNPVPSSTLLKPVVLDQVNDGPIFVRLSNVNQDNTLHVSTPLNNQGSVTGNPAASVSYTSTTSSITWSWSAFTLYFPDESTVAVASGSQNFTSLASNTTYYFEFYVIKSTGTMVCVMSDNSTAPASVQFLTQTVAADGHAVEVIDLTAATTSGGSGGGSGGGGTCFSGNTKIKTDQGFIRMDCLPLEFSVINKTGSHRAQLIVHHNCESPMLEMPNGCFVTEEHLLQTCSGWSPAREILKTKSSEIVQTLYDVHVITKDPANMHYILENGFIAHNKKRVCFSGDVQIRTNNGFANMGSLPENFKIENRDGIFEASLIKHQNCCETMCALHQGFVTSAHMLRFVGHRTWRESERILPKAAEKPNTLYNLQIKGSDFFELYGGLEANQW